MIIKTLTLKNFRNFDYEKIDFNEGINILAGKNGQGKTNVLEAINFCTFLRSFRAAKDEQLIKFGKDFAQIGLTYDSMGETNKIDITIFKDKPKELRKNGFLVSKNREFLGSFLSTVFTPDHLNMVKEGPIRRRAFIDMLICTLDIRYTDALLKYQKILSQRNSLLKKSADMPGFENLISVYDEKLCEEGAYISVKRAEYIRKLEGYARRIYSDISKDGKTLKLLYINQYEKEVTDIDSVREKMLLRLERMRNTDITMRMTTSGIQKDDMLILCSGKSLKYFGSQGQIRSAVLSLILAEGYVMREKIGVSPVIILDDIMSELDRTRQKYIFENADTRQCVISTCEIMKVRGKGNVMRVKEGRIV